MGNGITTPLRKEEKRKDRENGEKENSDEDIELMGKEIERRKCKHFRVIHQSSTGKKYLQIQKWLGEIEIHEDSNPLLPLPGYDLVVDLSGLKKKVLPSGGKSKHVRVPVLKKEK